MTDIQKTFIIVLIIAACFGISKLIKPDSIEPTQSSVPMTAKQYYDRISYDLYNVQKDIDNLNAPFAGELSMQERDSVTTILGPKVLDIISKSEELLGRDNEFKNEIKTKWFSSTHSRYPNYSWQELMHYNGDEIIRRIILR